MNPYPLESLRRRLRQHRMALLAQVQRYDCRRQTRLEDKPAEAEKAPPRSIQDSSAPFKTGSSGGPG